MALKKLAKLSIGLLLIIVITVYLIFSNQGLIRVAHQVSIKEVAAARQTVKQIVTKLSGSDQNVEISLTQQDIDAVMSVASHLIEPATFQSNLSPFGMTLNATIKVEYIISTSYINLQCLLTPGFNKFEFDNCKIGSISLPGGFVEWSLKTATHLLFGEEVKNTMAMLIDDAVINNNRIVLKATKSDSFKQDIKDSLQGATQIVRTVFKKKQVNKQQVQVYLDYLNSLEHQSDSLAYYIGKLFAQVRATASEDSNSEALWALMIVYANPGFGRYIGINYRHPHPTKHITLRGRQDLLLHFLYSAFLEQVGDGNIGVKIGEVKELLDSSSGGTGFSFADLAADKAGVKFAQMLTGDSAKVAAATLSNIDQESIFFPFIHDLPEGYRGKEFNQTFDQIDSSQYRALTKSIDQRINQLPLYASRAANRKMPVAVKVVAPPILGQWLVVDTHIHSVFSDGSQKIKKIAAKAQQYGCDAIAITDHGDFNLTKVASREYFNTIKLADAMHANLTVIPAMEWNLPPFQGREHATLLLPKDGNLQRKLSEFRNKYDSWGRKSALLTSASSALEWLDRRGAVDGIDPVVFYNHPSRKVFQLSENKHDFLEWADHSQLVIGFSGAPGHQRKRKSDNGSYEYEHHTINGWDPSIATIGGEWDQLLQLGYQVSAARASSDFHNISMDYWPCQFSTTHLYAQDNSHNQVIKAFKRGNFWAQHGKFVQQLNVNVQANRGYIDLKMGQKSQVNRGELITVSLNLTLNGLDWQGQMTSLDEVELIIITEDGTTSQRFEPALAKDSTGYHFVYQHTMQSSQVTFRWRGRSVQPEQHHYMFYTNPIYLTN